MASLRIFVADNGNPDCPRYMVRDNQGRYWDGKQWTEDPRSARLHYRGKDAVAEAAVLKDSPDPRVFTASVRITVEHDDGFSLEQLQALLERSTVSLVLPDQHDMEGVDVEITLDLRGMEETE